MKIYKLSLKVALQDVKFGLGLYHCAKFCSSVWYVTVCLQTSTQPYKHSFSFPSMSNGYFYLCYWIYSEFLVKKNNLEITDEIKWHFYSNTVFFLSFRVIAIRNALGIKVSNLVYLQNSECSKIILLYQGYTWNYLL